MHEINQLRISKWRPIC